MTDKEKQEPEVSQNQEPQPTDKPKDKPEETPKQNQEQKSTPKAEDKSKLNSKPKSGQNQKHPPGNKAQAKSNYYLKIIPKEEFPKFMERLQAALKKTDNKKGDKKFMDFEIRGAKEDLNGLAFEIFSYDKSKCAEFMDVTQENIKQSLYCISLNLNVKTEADVPKLNEAFLKLQDMFGNSPYIKGKFEFSFRSKDKRVSFDLLAKDGKLVKAFMDLGIDITEYHKFNFALKSGINLFEIFNPKADPTSNLVKIASIIFSVKSETDNVRYLCEALAEALKDVKLNDKEIQLKFDKFVGYLNFVNSFVGVKFNLEYDAKVLAGEGTKEAEKQVGGSEGLKQKIVGTQVAAMGMVQGLILPMINDFGMIDTVKCLDLDSISISLGVPKFQCGYAISLKIPGLTQLFDSLLNGPPSQQQKVPGK